MNMKTINLVWLFSLMAVGICSIILGGANLLGIGLSDFMIRGMGLVDLAALPILAYTTVKKLRNKQ